MMQIASLYVIQRFFAIFKWGQEKGPDDYKGKFPFNIDDRAARILYATIWAAYTVTKPMTVLGLLFEKNARVYFVAYDKMQDVLTALAPAITVTDLHPRLIEWMNETNDNNPIREFPMNRGERLEVAHNANEFRQLIYNDLNHTLADNHVTIAFWREARMVNIYDDIDRPVLAENAFKVTPWMIKKHVGDPVVCTCISIGFIMEIIYCLQILG